MLKLTTGLLTGAMLATGLSVGAANIDDIKATLNLTDSQVEVLESIHEQRQSGELDRDEAKAMIESADIDLEALHEARREMRDANKAERDAIFASGNYAAFVAAKADHPNAPEITEAQFDILVQAHALRESGDNQGARALVENAGIEQPGRGHGDEGKEGGERGPRGNRGPQTDEDA